MPGTQTTQIIQGYIDRLRQGDEAARDGLIGAANERLLGLTRTMLRDYPGVKRWEQSGDVMQNALIRLCRALEAIRPQTQADFFRLATLQIRRELIDLARHYYGPEGLGANYGSQAPAGLEETQRSAAQPSQSTYDPRRLAAWAEFHKQAEALPAEEREVFDLLWYQELGQNEAAEILGISLATLKRRWQAARRMLHDLLKGELPF
jgi:RNA polymerase sigma-70 factor (ECF subfamily)